MFLISRFDMRYFEKLIIDIDNNTKYTPFVSRFLQVPIKCVSGVRPVLTREECHTKTTSSLKSNSSFAPM